jgi:hypothetical protein
MIVTAVLFCTDPLGPSRVDPYFGAQAQAVRQLGGTVALIDHDALLAADIERALHRVPPDLGPVWYRGWMISRDHYAELEAALAVRGARLVVGTDEYRTAHELPGWYWVFAGLTPRSVWMPWSAGRMPDVAAVEALVAPLDGGAAVVKDYVKSRKYEWSTACFVPDLADGPATAKVIAAMVALQAESLNGGIVVRRFEEYEQRDGRSREARVWWLDGVPLAVGAHPDTPADRPELDAFHPELATVGDAVARLGCRFVTTDLAHRSDGAWRVIEVGDGQVSDLPVGLEPTAVLGRLLDHPHGG